MDTNKMLVIASVASGTALAAWAIDTRIDANIDSLRKVFIDRINRHEDKWHAPRPEAGE